MEATELAPGWDCDVEASVAPSLIDERLFEGPSDPFEFCALGGMLPEVSSETVSLEWMRPRCQCEEQLES